MESKEKQRAMRKSPFLEWCDSEGLKVITGPDGAGLEHHTQITFVRGKAQSARSHDNGAIAKEDVAFIGNLKPGHHAQRGTFAAATGAKQGHDLPVIDL